MSGYSDEKIDQLIDFLRTQFGNMGSRQGRMGKRLAEVFQDKELEDAFQGFHKKIVEQIRKAKEDLQSLENKRFENIKLALNKDGVNAPEEIQKKIASAFSDTDHNKSAQFFDEAIKFFDSTYDKNNPLIKEITSALEKGREARTGIKAQEEHLKDSRAKYSKLEHDAEVQVTGFFNTLNMRYAGARYNTSPWYLILKDMANGNDPNGNFLQEHFVNIGNMVGKFLEPLNLFLNGMRMLKEETLKTILTLDRTTASFMKATGQTEEYSDRIEDAWSNVRYMAISMEEVSQAYISFMDHFAGFSKASEETQQRFAEAGSIAARLGVSLQAQAQIFSYYGDALGRGTNGALQGLNSILDVANATGESLRKVTEQFVQALPEIAKWGNQTESVFKKMAATAKTLKIEISDVLQIAKGFDTFESAAGHVGRLNAILGGPFLNTMQMLQSNEADVVRSLHEAFKASGKNWGALSRHEKQAIATAAGIQNMATAQKIFNGSMADLNVHLSTQTMKQKELDDRAERAATIGERWATIMQTLAIAIEPLLDVIDAVLSALQWVASNLKSFTIPAFFIFAGVLRGGIGAMVGFGKFLVGLIPKALSTASTMMGLNTTLTATAAAGNAIGNPGLGARISGFFTALGQGGFAAVKGIGILSLGIIALGTAIGVAVGAGKMFFDIFSGIGSAIKDIFVESPMEEFQNEMADLTEVIDDTGDGFAGKMIALMTGVSTVIAAINQMPTGAISSLIPLFHEIAEIADNINGNFAAQFMDSLSKFMGFTTSITPSISNKFTQIQNSSNVQEKQEENEMKNKLFAKLNEIVELLKSSNGSGRGSGRANIVLEMDGTVFAEKVIEVVENDWRVR